MIEFPNEGSRFPQPDMIDKSQTLQQVWEDSGLENTEIAIFLKAIGMRNNDPVMFSFQVLLYNKKLEEIPESSYMILEGLFSALNYVGVEEARKNPKELKAVYGNFSGSYKLFRSNTTRLERAQFKKPLKDQSLEEITSGFMAKAELLHHLGLAVELDTSVMLIDSLWDRTLLEVCADAPETIESVLKILSEKQVIDMTPAEVMSSMKMEASTEISDLTAQTRKNVASDTLELGSDARDILRKGYEKKNEEE